MEYRHFGNTELVVSKIGFGAWAIGGGSMVGNMAIGWGNADNNHSKKALFKALDVGINFFDTADIYGLGHSEELIGDVLGRNEKAIIASKVGNVSRNNTFSTDYGKDYIITSCEASLKRLKRDVIDYYQLHSARVEDLKKEECIEVMNQLVKAGKIRYWGLSLPTFDPIPEAIYLKNRLAGNGFQLVLNIINRNSLPLIKELHAAGYGIIARMPLQFGLLSGKFGSESSFPDNDHRKHRLSKEIIDEFIVKQSDLFQLSRKYNITQAQLALSYILSYNEVSTVIPGIRTPEQCLLNTEGIVKLSNEDRDLVESIDFSELIKMMKEKG